MNQSTVTMNDGYWMYVLECISNQISKENWFLDLCDIEDLKRITEDRIRAVEKAYEVIATETRKNSPIEEGD